MPAKRDASFEEGYDRAMHRQRPSRSMAQHGSPPTVVPGLPIQVPQLGNTLPLPPWPSFCQGSGPTASDSTINLPFGFSQPLGGWPGISMY